MKVSELKAKFRRYSAEEKWQHNMQFIYREQMNIVQNIIDKVRELGGCRQ